MTHKKFPIAPELIFSNYWGTSAKLRLAVMYQSLGALLDKIGNPEIKINDSTIIERLLNSCAHWFSIITPILNTIKQKHNITSF